jgi:hypothetical protein
MTHTIFKICQVNLKIHEVATTDVVNLVTGPP